MPEKTQDSARELAELRFLSGQLETANQFEELYGRLLSENRQDKEMLRAMQRLLMQQACFLMNQWIKEKMGTKDAVAPLNGYPVGSLN